MKMNIRLVFILLIISASLPLYPETSDKTDDPIGNSYIVNHLEMESTSDPDSGNNDSLSGEIIFDDTFDETLSASDRKRRKANADPGAIKILQKKDSRWHLIEYRVKKNDNIWNIAKKNGIKPSDIISINNISSKGIIKEDDLLLLPSKTGVKYRIKKGDTLSSIAAKYNTDVEKIAEHNNIDGKRIIAGRTIFLPGAIEKKEQLPDFKFKKNNDKTQTIASKKSDKTVVNDKKKPEIASDINREKDNKLRLAWPLRGPITSGFGYRTHPFSNEKTFHYNLDIGAEIGTPVRASAEGVIIFSGWKGAYGNLIVIQHKNNYITVYAHNSKLIVEENEPVKKGQKIALSGKTGATTGAHLHFEIRKGIVPLNPSRILK